MQHKKFQLSSQWKINCFTLRSLDNSQLFTQRLIFEQFGIKLDILLRDFTIFYTYIFPPPYLFPPREPFEEFQQQMWEIF